jgi:hypothetical protein
VSHFAHFQLVVPGDLLAQLFLYCETFVLFLKKAHLLMFLEYKIPIFVFELVAAGFIAGSIPIKGTLYLALAL